MCDFCDRVRALTDHIGEFLAEEAEDCSLEVVYESLHAVQRVLELQTGMSMEKALEHQHHGRAVGEDVAESMGLSIPKEESLPTGYVVRDMMAFATLQPYFSKPN